MMNLYGRENLTQGIVLKSSPIKQKTIDQIINEKEKIDKDVVIVLDQVTDPHNIGSIMRSCSLFNCKTIIVSKDNAPDITPALAKIASGALELVDYIKVVNLNRTLQTLKKIGFWIYGLDSNKQFNNEQINLPKKCILVFGSEGKGIRSLTKKNCDNIISLPTNQNNEFGIDSLNVSNTCAIVLYEYFKKFNNNK